MHTVTFVVLIPLDANNTQGVDAGQAMMLRFLDIDDDPPCFASWRQL